MGKQGIVTGRGTPSKGLRVSSYLTLENELSEETCMLTKQEAFLGRGAWAAQREPGEGLCHVAHSLVFYGDGISSWVVSGQSF